MQVHVGVVFLIVALLVAWYFVRHKPMATNP